MMSSQAEHDARHRGDDDDLVELPCPKYSYENAAFVRNKFDVMLVPREIAEHWASLPDPEYGGLSPIEMAKNVPVAAAKICSAGDAGKQATPSLMGDCTQYNETASYTAKRGQHQSRATADFEQRARLLNTLHDDAVLAKWRSLLSHGASSKITGNWACSLSAKAGGRQSARLTTNHDNELIVERMYRCSHRKLTVSEYYRAMLRNEKGDEVRRIEGGPSCAAWLCRTAVAAGIIALSQWPLPYPETPPSHVDWLTVHEGVAVLFSCRYFAGTGDIPLTQSFTSDWCGVSLAKAAAALRWLEGGGAIRRAGSWGKGKMTVPTYLPG